MVQAIKTFSGLALALFPSFLHALITTSFEEGWDQTLFPMYTPSCSGAGKVTLETNDAHTGQQSLRVDGMGDYCGHAFFGVSEVPAGDLFVRAYIKIANALPDSHVTMITMPDAAQGSQKHLRVGGQSQVLIYNRESDDATLPSLSPDGIAASASLPANEWSCLLYQISQDGSIQTELNSAPVSGLSFTAGNSTATSATWAQKLVQPQISGIYFGWESYAGFANTVWYDDIAISNVKEEVIC